MDGERAVRISLAISSGHSRRIDGAFFLCFGLAVNKFQRFMLQTTEGSFIKERKRDLGGFS